MDRNNKLTNNGQLQGVVPRKGDVDRNVVTETEILGASKSSPARGTWIEITTNALLEEKTNVVPRKGDVDRNPSMAAQIDRDKESSPARGTWIEMRRSA